MPSQDYYSILGVARDATTQDIKRAFRQIARECHPDRSGGDPGAEERFKAARKAYETLMDPVTRARYDRRGKRRMHGGGGSFFDAFYKSTGDGGKPSPNKTGPTYAKNVTGGGGRKKKNRYDPGNDLDLDDLFNDFGDFGFGGKGRSRTAGARPKPSTSRVRTESPGSRVPQQGADVHIELDVPSAIAQRGGSVTAVYYRMQRADSWRPGSADPGVVRVQDIADVRIIPATRDGEVLRERGLGDAGAFGGPYGDLVVRVRIAADAPPPPPPPSSSSTSSQPDDEPRASSSAGPSPTPESNVVTLDITVVEALLGGRVQLKTPQGNVRLTVPPCTNSGTRLRLKNKGADGDDGNPTDLYVVMRIVTPSRLDDESRKLIEEFAKLNPDDPRG